MFELLNIGIDEINLKYMLESNPNIKELMEEEIIEKIELLRNIGCNDNYIKNIIISNPWYLDRCSSDVIEFIKKLIYLGITRIDLLINDNPYLLNIDVFELEEFIDKLTKENYSLEEIIDMFEENSNIIFEL